LAFWKKFDKKATTKYVFFHKGEEYDVSKEIGQIKDRGAGSITELSEDRLPLVLVWGVHTVEEYRRIYAAIKVPYRSTDGLPLAKEDIKLAFHLALFSFSMTEKWDFFETIQSGYATLSAYQPHDQIILDRMNALESFYEKAKSNDPDAKELAGLIMEVGEDQTEIINGSSD
jgi:hypothetical protein